MNIWGFSYIIYMNIIIDIHMPSTCICLILYVTYLPTYLSLLLSVCIMCSPSNVINILLLTDTPGLTSYWENVYTWQDRKIKLSDIDRTFYNTFARGSLSYLSQWSGDVHCSMHLLDISEVTIFKQADMFQVRITAF